MSATSSDSDKNIKDPTINDLLAPSSIRSRVANSLAGATTSPGYQRPAAPGRQPSGRFRGNRARRAGWMLSWPRSRGGGGRTARPTLSPFSSHLFERRLFRRAREGGTDRSQKRKMVPRILTSHLYIPGPSSSGGRHTPRRKPQSCRRRCRLGHHHQGSVAGL